MSAQSDLTGFLLARIAEGEQPCVCHEVFGGACGGGWCRADCRPCSGGDAYTCDEFRLAECEAKRRMVAEHEIKWDLSRYEQSWGNETFGCFVCHEFDGIICGAGYCTTLRLLALPYADHPDYAPAWRP